MASWHHLQRVLSTVQSCHRYLPPCKLNEGYKAYIVDILAAHISCRLLMFASGIPTAEKPTARKYYLLANGTNASEQHKNAWESYQRYLRSTSILIPIPPFMYRPLPGIIKRYLLLDFPMYQFNEETDGVRAIEEDKEQSNRRT